jgi:hypothetical protein
MRKRIDADADCTTNKKDPSGGRDASGTNTRYDFPFRLRRPRAHFRLDFPIPITVCPKVGGTMKGIAFIKEYAVED